MVKNLPASSGDMSSIPRLGRSSAERNGNLLQYSCLENCMDRAAWRATVHGGCKESDMTEHTRMHTHTHTHTHTHRVLKYVVLISDTPIFFLIFIWLYQVLVAKWNIVASSGSFR